MRLACHALIVAVVSIPGVAGAQKSDPAPPNSAALEKTAELIGVLAEVRSLQDLSNSATPVDRWQVLWLHQRISEQIVAASLEVDATIAQIDNEIAQASEIRGYLSDRRDRAVSRANLLSALVGGGLGATSSGLQFSSGLNKPAAAVGIGAGTASASLAVIGIHAQPGKTSRFNFSSNMLAEFFDRPALADSRYPAAVWTFLNEPSPFESSDVSRKQQLLQTWVNVRRHRLAGEPGQDRSALKPAWPDASAQHRRLRGPRRHAPGCASAHLFLEAGSWRIDGIASRRAVLAFGKC